MENVELCMFARMQLDIERDMKRLRSIKIPNCHFYTKIKEEMDYHGAKKHAQPSLKKSTVCPSCEQ